MSAINVTSEIAPLKKVLLHRPGKELLNLTPDTLGRLLFDDIPFLPDAIKEHEESTQFWFTERRVFVNNEDFFVFFKGTCVIY